MKTLMAVHAHPDDEGSSTGGVLARYADEGFQTVVVTCTNGDLGDMPGGIKPGQEGHDEEQVVKIRREELAHACSILGVTHLELLGYRDSGMADWEHKGHANAFCNVPLDEAVDRVVELFERYRPDVVVTYDPDSAYNHPDHIQASRVTMAATERSKIPSKVYWTAMRANRFTRIREMLAQSGVEVPAPPTRSSEWLRKAEEREARITTMIDVVPYVERKMDALRAHASQIHNFSWNRLPPQALTAVFGEECFVRVRDATQAPVPEDDLFAGLR
jgi:LmbE family N-acetylglucosaminyl deacetylase